MYNCEKVKKHEKNVCLEIRSANKTWSPWKQARQLEWDVERIQQILPSQHTTEGFFPCHPGHSRGHQPQICREIGSDPAPQFCCFHAPVAKEQCAGLFDHQLSGTLEPRARQIHSKKYQEIRGCFKLRGGTRHQFRFISHARSTRSARSARWIQVALATAALPQPAAGPQDPRSQRGGGVGHIQKSNRCLTSQSSLDRNSRHELTRQTWFSWIWTSQSYPGWLKGGEKEALKHGEGYTHPF